MNGSLPPAFDDLEESVLLFDGGGAPIDQNAAAKSFLGYTDEKLTRSSLETFTPNQTATSPGEIHQQLERAVRGEVSSFEWQIRRANGEHRWVLAKASPATFTDVGPSVLAEIRDLTRYKARGRRLQLLYRVLRHNLRNDMTVIQGYASNLEAAIQEDDLETQVEVIKRTAERVGGFSESVANLERLIEHDATERQQIHVTELLAEIVTEVREASPDVSFETEFRNDPWVSADEGLKLALEHTLDNAVTHNDADDPAIMVTVTTDASDSYARIRILDNGPGIPEIELNALEGSISDIEHGTGLGLWLIKQCTESLGGSVTFDTDNQTGTRVTLTLPRIDPPVGQ